MGETLRWRLTRLHMIAVLSAIGALITFITGAIAFYLGFSAAEEELALPYAAGPLEYAMFTVALGCVVVTVVATARYIRLSRRAGR